MSEFTAEAEELLDGASIDIQAERHENSTSFILTDSNGVVQTTFEILNQVEEDLSLSQYASVVISNAHVALLEHLRKATEEAQAAQASFDSVADSPKEPTE